MKYALNSGELYILNRKLYKYNRIQDIDKVHELMRLCRDNHYTLLSISNRYSLKKNGEIIQGSLDELIYFVKKVVKTNCKKSLAYDIIRRWF